MKIFFKRHSSDFSGYALLLFLALVAFSTQLFFSSPTYTASAPTIFTYQGKLLQSSSAVTTTKAMTFLLFDASSGGNLLYTASGTISTTSTVSVTPENGLFTIQLGATGTNALDATIFQNNSAVFLEVWVSGQVMTPRKRITSAPFAFNAQYLMGYSATTTSSSTYIPLSDNNGNFTFSGAPQSSAVGGGAVFINTTSTSANRTLFGIADSGVERFKVDKEGDTWVGGAFTASGTTSLVGVNPTHKGAIVDGNGGATLSGAQFSFVSGHYAYVTAFTGHALEIVDISNPQAPVHKGSLANGVGGALLTNPEGIYVSGNYAYIASFTNNALEIVDISNPASPVHKGSIVGGADTGAALGGAIAVVVSGNYAYVAASASSSLEIIDISNPARPVHKGKLTNGVGGANLEGATWLAISGNYAYVASYTGDALEIVDISDPANPTHKGKLSNGGSAALDGPISVAISGNNAYVASYVSDALEIVDISDPANPTHKGKLTHGTGGAVLSGAISLAVAGNYAYVASSPSSTLEIVDISSSTNPVHKAALTHGSGGATVAGITHVQLAGNYAYIMASNSSTLQIVDITGATISQAEIGTTKTTNLEVMSQALFGQDVSVRGGLAIGNNGLLLSGSLGMSAPTTTINATNTLNFSHTVLFQTSASTTASNAFVFNTANTLGTSTLLSIRNNGTSRLTLDNNGNLGINTTTLDYRFTVNGTSYFVATTTLAGNLVFSTASSSISGLGALTMSGLFTQTGTSNLATTTISVLTTTATTTLATTTITSSTITILNVAGQSYFGGTSTMANLLNLEGRIGAPVHKGSLASPTGALSGAQSVFVSGNYAYVASFVDDALEIVDITNPASPTHRGSISNGSGGALLDGAYAVYVAGNYAYVVSYASNAFQIFDISNPATTTVIGTLTNGVGGAALNGPRALYVSGNYVYVLSDVSNALEIIDISDPTTPRHMGSIADGGSVLLSTPTSVFVSGNYAYITALASNALEIIDVSDPANPKHAGSVVNGGGGGASLSMPIAVTVVDNYAYVAAYGSNALEILDISNPTSPTHKGSLSGAPTLLGQPTSVFVSGDFAYVVSEGSDGFEIVDVSNPASPTHKGSLANAAGGALLVNPQSVHVYGNYAYVASGGSNALEIIDVSGATISQARIGSIKTSNIQVSNHAIFGQSLNIRGGLMVGNNGLLLSGDFGMSSPTSSNVTSATNTLRFSHTALFRSSATTTEGSLFIFDTVNNFSTAVSSTYLLSVRNNGRKAFSIASNGDVAASGTFYAANATIGTPGTPGDLAERVDIAPDDAVEPGDVVVVDAINSDTYRRSAQAYDTRVSGVISTNPTIVVGNGRTNYTAIMAMVGRVPIKVSSENGPIQRGDLLVSASLPGYAMRYDQAHDDTSKLVGVVGIALDSMTSGTGKIMGLVRTGWVHNRNQALAGMEGIAAGSTSSSTTPAATPAQLTVQQNNAGSLVFADNQTVDVRSYAFINVAAISGLHKKWQIDAEGRLVTQVQTQRGTKSIYAVQSQSTEYIFSGADQLVGGEKKILFDEDTIDIIDVKKPLKISVTLTSAAQGIYVQAKDEHGFTVRELGGGTSAASFDWVVIAVRKDPNEVPEAKAASTQSAVPSEKQEQEATTPASSTAPVPLGLVEATSTAPVTASTNTASEVPAPAPVPAPVSAPAAVLTPAAAEVAPPATEPAPPQSPPPASELTSSAPPAPPAPSEALAAPPLELTN